MPLNTGVSFLELDEYHKSAIILAANDIIKERSDAENKVWKELKAKQEDVLQSSYKSNFDSLPKPRTFN